MRRQASRAKVVESNVKKRRQFGMSERPLEVAPTAMTAFIRHPATIAVLALGITQIIAWGTTLYALGVLGKPIAADTGLSSSIPWQ